MSWELRTICLAAVLLLGAAPAPLAPTDLNAPDPPSVMKGTVEERNAAVKAVLAGGGGRVEQISFQQLDFATVLRLLGMQTRIDIRPDWNALKKAGIEPTTQVSANLFSVTQVQAFHAIFTQIRPAKGRIDLRVENGVLLIVPTEEETPLPETANDKTQDAAAIKMLKDRFDAGELLGRELTMEELIRQMSMKRKINVIIDWRELGVVNIARDTKVTIDATDATGEGFLNAIFAKLQPVGGSVGYDCRWGMVRISTAERLAKEKKLAEAVDKAEAFREALP